MNLDILHAHSRRQFGADVCHLTMQNQTCQKMIYQLRLLLSSLYPFSILEQHHEIMQYLFYPLQVQYHPILIHQNKKSYSKQNNSKYKFYAVEVTSYEPE